MEQTLTIDELNSTIALLRSRGADNVEAYVVEKYMRYMSPFAIIILAFIGVIVSARKSRGGAAFQIALGFLIAFVFIICFMLGREFALKNVVSPLLGVWMPNIIFTVVSLLVYRTVPRQMASTRDYLELHFIVLLWGFTAILGVLISIPVVELVFYRTLFAAALLGLLLWFRGTSFRLGKYPTVHILLVGILIGAHWITFFLAARISNVSVCLAGFSTIALWTSILEPMILSKRFQWYEVLLGLITILGLYVIFRFEFEHAWGLILAVISAFLGALFTVLNGHFTQRFDHFAITFYEMIGAAVSIVLIFPWYSNWQTVGLQLVPTAMDWVYLFILAAVCTVYAYSISVELMKRISAFAINLTVNLEPVYGIILAVIIFGEKEKMTPGFYWGTGIILLAVLSYPVINRWLKKSCE